MYSRLNYIPGETMFYSKSSIYFTKGHEIYQHFQNESQRCLRQFIYENNHIDGSSLKEHWFNIKDADIFLSHSHKDIDEIKCFAGWLFETFGLVSFIDSCSWGYCDDLLKLIDDKYCKNLTSNTYDYQLRNYTTSHVHMMLGTALSEMIDKCECILFYNTPNSITLKTQIDNVKNNNIDVTLSPWIYHELSTTSMIQKRYPERIEKSLVVEHSAIQSFEKRAELVVEYDVTKLLEKMISLTEEHLWEWKVKNTVKGSASLDVLYNILTIR